MLSANSPNSDISYRWFGPNSYFSDQQNPEVDEVGEYVVVATAPNGCIATDQVTVFVGGNGSSVNAGPDQTICEGSTVQLAGQIGGSASSGTWSTSGDGSFNNVSLLNAIYTPGPTDISNGSV